MVVGGSRGLGLGLVEALAASGAKVTAVARDAVPLAEAKARLGVETVAADATDAGAATRILSDLRPDLLVLNAGAPPVMGRIDSLSWEDFSASWNSDTKIGLHWTQAALKQPLAPESLVILVSSGAAVSGSPLSGGYAGAKRALWFVAGYAGALSEQLGLGIRFRVVVPRQMVAGTGTGDAGLAAYAAAAGVSVGEQAEKWPVMPPLSYGKMLAERIESGGLIEANVFAVRGDTGVTVVE